MLNKKITKDRRDEARKIFLDDDLYLGSVMVPDGEFRQWNAGDDLRVSHADNKLTVSERTFARKLNRNSPPETKMLVKHGVASWSLESTGIFGPHGSGYILQGNGIPDILRNKFMKTKGSGNMAVIVSVILFREDFDRLFDEDMVLSGLVGRTILGVRRIIGV